MDKWWPCWWASHVSLVCHWWCHWYILVLVFGMVSIPKIWRLSRCQSVKTEVSTTGESWRFKPPNIGDSYDQDLGMKWDFSALETIPCSRMFKTSRLVSECFRYITQGHMRFFFSQQQLQPFNHLQTVAGSKIADLGWAAPQVTRDMTLHYINDPRTIVLAVSSQRYSETI